MSREANSNRKNNRKNGIPRRYPDKGISEPLIQFSQLSGKALHEAEEAISSRQKLTQRFLKEIEKEITEAMKMLRFLGDPWKRGDKTDYEFMRISLDKALTARKKDRRGELLRSWKDLLELQEKRLELLRENLALRDIEPIITKPKNKSLKDK